MDSVGTIYNSTVRPKILPMKLRDLLNSSDESRTEDAPLTDRKKIEPMKMKDLIRSLSTRKKPEAPKHVYPSKSADRYVNVPRKSTAFSSTHDSHARRKLYSTQNTPLESKFQSRLKPTLKTQPKPTGDFNQMQSSRKSFLLPPNTIKEYYMHRKKNKETLMKTTFEDAAVQTDTETKKTLTKDPKLTNNYHCLTERNSEMFTTTESSKDTASNKNLDSGKSTCIDREQQILTSSSAPVTATDATENDVNKDNRTTQAQGPKPVVFAENECLLFVHPLHSNQIIFQVPETAENPRTVRNIPTKNSTFNVNAEHLIVNKSNLIAVEEFLKEGIVNMTQALNIVQTTLYSNSLQPQVQYTVSSDKEFNSTFFPPPVIQNVFNSASGLCETIDIKTETLFGDTSPPSITSLTQSISEINFNDELSNEKSTPPDQVDALKVGLESCLKFPSTSVLSETNISTATVQKTPEDTNSTKASQQFSRISSKKYDDILRATPVVNLKRIEDNLPKTPKTGERSLLMKTMTPSRKADNKENFQTPMSRRKTFSGLDSQNLRRSTRIARHLRQSLGEDSFLALERELNIVYPGKNI